MKGVLDPGLMLCWNAITGGAGLASHSTGVTDFAKTDSDKSLCICVGTRFRSISFDSQSIIR